MAPKKDSKTKVRVQPVPEKRGYEFGGPYVLNAQLQLTFGILTLQSRCVRDRVWSARAGLQLHLPV